MILWVALIANLLSNFSRGDSSEATCATYFFFATAASLRSLRKTPLS